MFIISFLLLFLLYKKLTARLRSGLFLLNYPHKTIWVKKEYILAILFNKSHT